MDWHARYLRQAAWTRDLRARTCSGGPGWTPAAGVLEVGCGTGAILADLPAWASLHGLDLDPDSAGGLPGERPFRPTGPRRRPRAALPLRLLRHRLLPFPAALGGRPCGGPARDEAHRPPRRVGAGAGRTRPYRPRGPSRRVGAARPLAGRGPSPSGRRPRLREPPRGDLPAGRPAHRGDEDASSPAPPPGSPPQSGNPSGRCWNPTWAARSPPSRLEALRLADHAARLRGERVLDVPTYFAWSKVAISS